RTRAGLTQHERESSLCNRFHETDCSSLLRTHTRPSAQLGGGRKKGTLSARKDDAGSAARSPVTMEDVARVAWVSKSSVSRALNDVPGGVAPAVAERVRRAVEELGYVPNAIAASLKQQRTKTVGMILPDLGNPFFALVAAGIEAETRDAGYTLLVANTSNDH